MFKVGQKVVYPAHGVGVIESVQSKTIAGSEKKFYMLRFLESDMTIMVPMENVESVGLRPIIGKATVSKVYKILRDKKVEIEDFDEETHKACVEFLQGRGVPAEVAKQRATLLKTEVNNEFEEADPSEESDGFGNAGEGLPKEVAEAATGRKVHGDRTGVLDSEDLAYQTSASRRCVHMG